MHRLLRRRFDCGDTVHDLLYFFEGTDLDLAHALARHTEFAGQLSKRHRVFGQAPALENASGTRFERAKRNEERAATVIEFLARREHRLLVRGVTNQPVLPFGGIAFLADSVVERDVAAEPAVHVDHRALGDAQAVGDELDLIWAHIALIQRGNPALGLA